MRTATQKAEPEILKQNVTVCLVDRDADYLSLTKNQLERAGFPVVTAVTLEEALHKVRRGACGAVLANAEMPEIDGLALLDSVLQQNPEVCVILAADAWSSAAALEAIKRGAYDFLAKPLDFAYIGRILHELSEAFSQRAELRSLQETLYEIQPFPGMVGNSAAILDVFDLAKRLSHHTADILISGPPGVGKAHLARALHDFSAAAQEPFVVCDCSTLAETLLRGQLPAADGVPPASGTFFVSEIAEASLSAQGKLLAAIRSRDLSRLGSGRGKQGTLRIIAATSRDLHAETLAGCFRDDLFLRLSAVEIHVPSLAERPDDIPVLVHHFVRKYNQVHATQLQGLTRRASLALLQHDWPGNAREVENVIGAAAAAAHSDWIDLCDLPQQVQEPHRHSASAVEDWQPAPLDEMRRIHIERMLTMCNGNRVRAARILGIGRTSLYRFLKRTARQAQAASAQASD